MSNSASRPIVVSVVNTGVVYVPIARERQNIMIQVTAGGLTGVAADYTLDNVTRGPASSYDVNNIEHVPAASANWDPFEANLVSTPMTVAKPLNAFALRLTGTGTGTARVVITQES